MYNAPIFMHSFIRSEQVHKTTEPRHLHSHHHKPTHFHRHPPKNKNFAIHKSLMFKNLPSCM